MDSPPRNAPPCQTAKMRCTRWGDGEIGRWGDGVMGRWGDFY
ncbi:hypothetical protein [Moorena sp. SIO4G3]|nr:hypothetical protein [Moorena sp. SIO4G3]